MKIKKKKNETDERQKQLRKVQKRVRAIKCLSYA